MKDYYNILEIERTASSDEIKKAYRHLAKKWHPDACKLPNSHEKFVEITEAYEILIDSRKRKEYDELWNRYKHDQEENYKTNNARDNTYNDSNTQYHYTNQAYENYYREKEQSFTANQAEARRRAQTYYSMSLDDLLNMVLGVVIDSTVKVAKYTVLGEEDVKLTFGDRLRIGFQVLLFILMVALTFTGVLAPIGAPLGMLLFKSMMKKGRFIGIGKMVTSTLMLVGLLILGVLIVYFISSVNDNSYTYNDSNTYDEPFNNWEESQNTNNSYSEDGYNDNSVGELNYVKPTQIPKEKLNLIVDAFIEVGRSAYGYQYSHTEIGEVIKLDNNLYQTYNIIQIDTIENRENKIWKIYEPINSEIFYVESNNVLYELDAIIYYRSFVPAESVTWTGKQEWDGQEVMCFNALDEYGIQCYRVDLYTCNVALAEDSYSKQDEPLPLVEPDENITSNEESYSDEVNICIEQIKSNYSYSDMEVVPLYDYIIDENIASRYHAFYGEDTYMNQMFVVDKQTYELYLYDDRYNIAFGDSPISVANIVYGLSIYVDHENIEWAGELPIVPVQIENISDQEVELYGLGVRGESSSSSTKGLYADIEMDLKGVEKLLPGEQHTIELRIIPVDPYRGTSLCFFHVNDISNYEYYTYAPTRTAY